jgi:hypothetical protein
MLCFAVRSYAVSLGKGGALRHLSLLLVLASGSFLAGCTVDPYGICRSEEARGVYTYNKDNSCGCERRSCPMGSHCFKGDCDPKLEATNPQRCGCQEACAAGTSCVDGKCCDAKAASSRENCGCGGACKIGEQCTKSGLEGAYACACDAKLTQFDSNNCACQGPCAANQESCIQGACTCNPLSSLAKIDDKNCGCKGPCPEGSACSDGVCHCRSANTVMCNTADGFRCVAQHDCECNPKTPPTWARADVRNCGCNGPCGSGELCSAGRCMCDPVAHASDNQNCGCGGACDTAAGFLCQGGKCLCDPYNLNNAQNCACKGACPRSPMAGAYDWTCVNGTCSCPTITKYLCEPAGLDSSLPRFDNVCWGGDIDHGQLCLDCRTLCLEGTHCKYSITGGAITSVACGT